MELIIMLYKVVLCFESADEILKCAILISESYWAALSIPVVLIIMLYKEVLTFESVDEIPMCTATKQYFPVVLFIMLYKVALTFESVDEILKCGYSNEGY